MSYPTGGAAGSMAPTKRPAALTAAIVAALMGVLGHIASAAGILTGGKAAIKAFVEEQFAGLLDGAAISQIVGTEIDRAYGLLVTKAYIGVGAAVLVLTVALLAARGPRVRRPIFVLVLLVNMVAAFLQLGEYDVLPDLSVMGGALAVLACPVSLVLLFVPAVGRYARQEKQPKSDLAAA